MKPPKGPELDWDSLFSKKERLSPGNASEISRLSIEYLGLHPEAESFSSSSPIANLYSLWKLSKRNNRRISSKDEKKIQRLVKGAFAKMGSESRKNAPETSPNRKPSAMRRLQESETIMSETAPQRGLLAKAADAWNYRKFRKELQDRNLERALSYFAKLSQNSPQKEDAKAEAMDVIKAYLTDSYGVARRGGLESEIDKIQGIMGRSAPELLPEFAPVAASLCEGAFSKALSGPRFFHTDVTDALRIFKKIGQYSEDYAKEHEAKLDHALGKFLSERIISAAGNMGIQGEEDQFEHAKIYMKEMHAWAPLFASANKGSMDFELGKALMKRLSYDISSLPLNRLAEILETRAKWAETFSPDHELQNRGKIDSIIGANILERMNRALSNIGSSLEDFPKLNDLAKKYSPAYDPEARLLAGLFQGFNHSLKGADSARNAGNFRNAGEYVKLIRAINPEYSRRMNLEGLIWEPMRGRLIGALKIEKESANPFVGLFASAFGVREDPAQIMDMISKYAPGRMDEAKRIIAGFARGRGASSEVAEAYNVLGLQFGANEAEIKKSYYAWAKKNRTDLDAHDQSAGTVRVEFEKRTTAYKLLIGYVRKST